MWKGWIPGAIALAGTVAWLAMEPAPQVRSCASSASCAAGERCVQGRCRNPIRLVVAVAGERRALPCGDGVCDLAGGECEGLCPVDCPDVPCGLPCVLDGVCAQEEGRGCPDCWPAGCNFDGLCTVGESGRCPDCSCGDGYCDSGAGECVGTCEADCPTTPCVRACDFDAACEEGEGDGCPDCSCGDGICDPRLEACDVCVLDCGPCAEGCGDGICTADDPPGCPDCVGDD